MGLFDEPDHGVYRLTKSGTLALLDAVNKADAKGASALASKDKACEAVVAYLDASFLGSFLRSGQRIPYAENAGVLGTYIDFLDHELATGATHATSLHQTHLKLLAYVAAIEAEAPLSVFGNGLEFLGGKRQGFDFGIYYKEPSANTKLEAVGRAREGVAVPAPFQALYERLRQLVDRGLRNAIAHATYRVLSDHERVDFWNRGQLEASRTFKEVDDMYRDARSYQQGFVAAVSDFANAIHPDCPYAWHPGRPAMGVGGGSEAPVGAIEACESGSRLRLGERRETAGVIGQPPRGDPLRLARLCRDEEGPSVYAVFRIGKALFSGSRKSMTKGARGGPSPGRPRGGLVARWQAGGRPRNASAGVAPRSP